MQSPTLGQADVLFSLDSVPPLRVALGAAIQHLLAIFAGIVTPALVVCGLCGASPALTRQVAGASLFISGVSTFIQIHRFGAVGSGLLSIQGTSSSFIAVFAGMAGAGLARGETPEQMLGLMMGMGFVCALVEVGLSQVLPWMRRVITPLVAGIVITLIGLTLIQVSVRQIGGCAAALGVALGRQQARLVVGHGLAPGAKGRGQCPGQVDGPVGLEIALVVPGKVRADAQRPVVLTDDPGAVVERLAAE